MPTGSASFPRLMPRKILFSEFRNILKHVLPKFSAIVVSISALAISAVHLCGMVRAEGLGQEGALPVPVRERFANPHSYRTGLILGTIAVLEG